MISWISRSILNSLYIVTYITMHIFLLYSILFFFFNLFYSPFCIYICFFIISLCCYIPILGRSNCDVTSFVPSDQLSSLFLIRISWKACERKIIYWVDHTYLLHFFFLSGNVFVHCFLVLRSFHSRWNRTTQVIRSN